MAVPQPRRQVQFQEETGYVFDGEVAGESEMVQVFAKFEIEASGLKQRHIKIFIESFFHFYYL
jgi:hypothetical protein